MGTIQGKGQREEKKFITLNKVIEMSSDKEQISIY